jgi:lysophospholipase L1-like esterase
MIRNILLSAASVLVGLLLLEIGCRALLGVDGLVHWKNIVLEQRLGVAGQNTGRFVYDPLLGFTPNPRFATSDTHYDARGFRRMPPPPAGATDGPPILATGDSYTLGDEVADDESWPAVLQGLIGRRTINAGVAAYGFDQTVLRTERLAAELKPSVIVVGFIADDLRRAEMSRTWGTEKPYFTLTGDETLELHNVPVPPSPRPQDTLDFWQWAFGWSVLVDTVLKHQGLAYEWGVDHQRATPAGTGGRLACALMNRLAKLGVPVLVVAEYDFYVWVNPDFAVEQRRLSQAVLKCAAATGFATLDLYDRMAEAVRAEGREKIYRAWHPGPPGYRLIAQEIAAELDRLHMPPR